MRVPGIPYVQGRNSYPDRDGRKYGIAIHNTANDATAEQEASYATRRTDGVSSHFYADAGSIVQSLDTDARAGHAGSYEGNEHAVAVEITGVNGWTRAQWLDRVAWDKLARVLAVVCQRYGIEPRRASVAEMRSNPKVRAIYGHDDMRRAWGGTTHTDPGGNFPWDYLFNQVKQVMEEDAVTYNETWRTDRMRNPYSDKATNPTIWPETAMYNIGGATDRTDKAVERIESALAVVSARLAALESRPPVQAAPVDVDALVANLRPAMEAAAEAAVRRVLGAVDEG